MQSRKRSIGVSAVLLILLLTKSSSSVDQATGKLYGDIKFTNLSSALSSYLAANATANATDGVSAFRLGLSTSPAATSGYQASNTALSGNEWRTATYDIHPPVAAGGTQFLVTANI